MQNKSSNCLDSPSAPVSDPQYFILQDLVYTGKAAALISDSKSMGSSSPGEHDQPAHTPWHFRDIFRAVCLGKD